MNLSVALRRGTGVLGRSVSSVTQYSTGSTASLNAAAAVNFDESRRQGKKTLVIGASGSIGQQLLEALNKRMEKSTIAGEELIHRFHHFHLSLHTK